MAATTALIYPLREITPDVSNGVVYMLAVLLVSTYWGLGLGLATALASALAFNFFHIPPTGRLAIAEAQNYVALGVFLIAAAIASTVADLARARAREAERRREEADLAADLARLLLGGTDLGDALGSTAHRLAEALDLPSVSIELEQVDGDQRRLALPLAIGESRQATLLVPASIDPAALARLRERVVPALEALLSAALDREALQVEVVETRALRRSDSVKTAILRAVSHDLRTPLTTIVAASAAVGSPTLSSEEREELGASIGQQAGRLSRLVDQLLDLSRLEAGTAQPRREWCSIEELIRSAADEVGDHDGDSFALSIDGDLPLINADAAQLERALVNLLENGRRHSGGHPVKVRAGTVGQRLMVRIVDRGPGIQFSELPRIFEPFYRGTDDGQHSGAGLGLAIARGLRGGQPRSSDGRVAARAGNDLRGRAAASIARGSRGPEQRGGGPARVSAAGRRVLVCDDELQIIRALRVILRGQRVRGAGHGDAKEALDTAAVENPDAAIIDLLLPDGNGIEICAQLRSWSEMPILVLSAVGEEAEKVRALEAGADDYVTKPFGPRELVARLEAALRRAGPEADQPVLRTDGLELDISSHAVRRDGTEVHLTPTEFNLLKALMSNRGRLDDPRRPADPGLGPGLCRRRGDAAHPHRQPAAKGRAGGRQPAHPHRGGDRLPVRRLSF